MTTPNRRQFLSGLAAAPFARAAEKIRIGVIGCGWYGMTDLQNAFKAGGVECLALSDVDSEHLGGAAAAVERAQGSRPKTFKHYRELLETPNLHAVIIATPPHWHALPFIEACAKRLSIYCEKPLAYDIRAAKLLKREYRAPYRHPYAG